MMLLSVIFFFWLFLIRRRFLPFVPTRLICTLFLVLMVLLSVNYLTMSETMKEGVNGWMNGWMNDSIIE
jgi:hypothetical protein